MSSENRSPLAPDGFPDFPAVGGVRMATAASGIRYQGRDDLTLFECAPGTQVAGVFTTNKIVGAPVEWTRKNIRGGLESEAGKMLIVNAGNANVFTGAPGRDAVQSVARCIAAEFGIPEMCGLQASTGVIGEPLDASKITDRMGELRTSLSENGWEKAARAIMTTDTFPKGAIETATIGGRRITIAGIAKGSGMIAPNMATMLGFVFTDAAIERDVLQALLEQTCARSFNAITVDGDTSTSDMVLLAASGAANNPEINDINDPELKEFSAALGRVMEDLAVQIVRDGEGAAKLVSVMVTGAPTLPDAKLTAMSIANSPLVKTAIAGEDANWGRIMMAAGKSGASFDPAKLSLSLGGVAIARNGELCDDYTEDAGAEHMKQTQIDIRLDLGSGSESFRAWTCDLTHRYIDINADYRS